MWTRLRAALRLIACDSGVRSDAFPGSFSHTYDVIHRFEETIGGRVYQIDVVPVSNRWRAQLHRTAGMPTAMMPFYGTSPDEAARQLAEWLALAHRRLASQAPASV